MVVVDKLFIEVFVSLNLEVIFMLYFFFNNIASLLSGFKIKMWFILSAYPYAFALIVLHYLNIIIGRRFLKNDIRIVFRMKHKLFFVFDLLPINKQEHLTRERSFTDKKLKIKKFFMIMFLINCFFLK